MVKVKLEYFMKLLPTFRKKKEETPVSRVDRPKFSEPKTGRFKIKNPLKRQRKEEKTKVPDFGASHRKERTQRKRSERFRRIKRIFIRVFSFRFNLITLSFTILVIISLLFILFMHSQQAYIVKTLQVVGIKEIGRMELDEVLNEYLGRSMFTFSEGSIEAQLLAEFPYIRTVEVQKILPGKLNVSVQERFPIFVYNNLSGVALIDREMQVIDVPNTQESVGLTTNELLIVEGYGDPNADYVYEKFLSKIDDEEKRAELDWAEVELEKKVGALEELRRDLLIRVESALNRNSDILLELDLPNTQLVFGYDAMQLGVGDLFPEDLFLVTEQVITNVPDLLGGILKMTWQSQFSLVIETESGVNVEMTSSKDVEEQLHALQVILAQEEIPKNATIDLRSDLISVR